MGVYINLFSLKFSQRLSIHSTNKLFCTLRHYKNTLKLSHDLLADRRIDLSKKRGSLQQRPYGIYKELNAYSDKVPALMKEDVVECSLLFL